MAMSLLDFRVRTGRYPRTQADFFAGGPIYFEYNDGRQWVLDSVRSEEIRITNYRVTRRGGEYTFEWRGLAFRNSLSDKDLGPIASADLRDWRMKWRRR